MRTPVVLLLATIVVGLFAGIAYGFHVHTVGEWDHGLGDGANNNYYVHPYNDNLNGHTHSNTVWVGKDANVLATDGCSCSHSHISWDTSPYSETQYWSYNVSDGTHALNGHYHAHE
jgi:hypothetical protein